MATSCLTDPALALAHRAGVSGMWGATSGVVPHVPGELSSHTGPTARPVQPCTPH